MGYFKNSFLFHIKKTLWFFPVFVIISLVPGDGLYYHVESLLSHLGPLGTASQHVRTIPSTTNSILMEIFRGHVLQVEGIKIHRSFAVNPTENVEQGEFYSHVLEEERKYWIYLPPGYAESNEFYPTLYLLHGMSQGHRWWAEVARMDRIATSMIEAGKVSPMIMVMPNGNFVQDDVSTTGLYDNRCQTGLDVVARSLKAIGDRIKSLRIYKISCEADFENYIANDVVGEIDKKFRTNGERYVGGFSVGGRGAIQLALMNGQVFDGGFGLSGNYQYLREALRRDEVDGTGLRLFLASGDKDQRGLYGGLNTFLFHKDLSSRDVEHVYCIYEGTHSDLAWISAMPQALEYLFAPDSSGVPPTTDSRCSNIGPSAVPTLADLTDRDTTTREKN